jgi:hypothetical protein
VIKIRRQLKGSLKEMRHEISDETQKSFFKQMQSFKCEMQYIFLQ